MPDFSYIVKTLIKSFWFNLLLGFKENELYERGEI